MITYDFLYDFAMAEEGGFGIWYEYLAKYQRIFKKYLNYKKVLIFGLPSKYSLGLDTLSFAENSKLEIVDKRDKILKEYTKFAKQFSKNIKILHTISLDKFNPKKKYDLIISTEVIQDNPRLLSKMKELGKTIIVFAPNKECYAHPRISKLNSLSLKYLKKIAIEQRLKIIKLGYIDCPPWPAGGELPKSDGLTAKLPFYITILKSILNYLTPKLAKLDKFYFTPWKELNSHMIYGIFENEQIQ